MTVQHSENSNIVIVSIKINQRLKWSILIVSLYYAQSGLVKTTLLWFYIFKNKV